MAPAANRSPDGFREAVLDLSNLNARCCGGLMKTDQRELLCRLILAAARAAGLDPRGAINEEWRTR